MSSAHRHRWTHHAEVKGQLVSSCGVRGCVAARGLDFHTGLYRVVERVPGRPLSESIEYYGRELFTASEAVG